MHIKTPSARYRIRSSIGWLVAIILLGGLLVDSVAANQAPGQQTVLPLGDLPSGVLDETSGGTMIGDKAYLVNDDGRKIYRLDYQASQDSFRLNTTPIGIFGLNKDRDVVWDKGLKVADLEGAASFGDRLYLVTSHANTRKKGSPKMERQFLLELALDADGNAWISRSTQELRQIIQETVFEQEISGPGGRFIVSARPWTNELGVEEVMNIEGLAIDDEGHMYLGFRSPLAGPGYALVLRSHVDEIFATNVSFDTYLLDLDLGPDGPAGGHGITAMEFDPVTSKLVILSNSQHRHERLTPTLWVWDPNRSAPGRVTTAPALEMCRSVDSHISQSWKPETLLVSTAEASGIGAALQQSILGAPGRMIVIYDMNESAQPYFQSFGRAELCPALSGKSNVSTFLAYVGGGISLLIPILYVKQSLGL